MAKKPIGPNVKRLIAHKMSLLAVPPGTSELLAAGMQAFLERGRLAQIGKEASAWEQAVIAAVKTALDNPYGDDDEVIAGEILKRVEEKREAKKGNKKK